MAQGADATVERDAGIRVLLVEESDAAAERVCSALDGASEGEFTVTRIERLDLARRELACRAFDAAILGWPSRRGARTFAIGCARALARHLPVVLLTHDEPAPRSLSEVGASSPWGRIEDPRQLDRLPAQLVECMGRDRSRRSGAAPEARDTRAANGVDPLTDPVTGLPNDIVFGDRLGQGLERVGREAGPIAVVRLRIDQLDELAADGSAPEADALLASAAGILATCIRRTDTLARVDDDVFGILFEGLRRPEDAAAVARGLAQALDSPKVDARIRELHGGLTATLGVAVITRARVSVAEAVERAEQARRRAESRGGNRIVVDSDA